MGLQVVLAVVGILLLGMCDIQSLLLGNSKVVEKICDHWNPVVYSKLVYLLKSIFYYIRSGEPVAREV